LDDRSQSLAAQTWPSDLIEDMKGLGKIPEAMSASAFPLPKNIDHIRSLWPAGETEARERLERFANNSPRISGYNDSRNIPSDIEGTSRLSPYLSLGMVSARECIRMAKTKKGTGVDTWISELCWRDFYRHVLFHFPRVGKNQPFKESFKKVKWQDDEKGFEAWKNGKTQVASTMMMMMMMKGVGFN
jgi:deoxyribodipyrimidine photo-lyase